MLLTKSQNLYPKREAQTVKKPNNQTKNPKQTTQSSILISISERVAARRKGCSKGTSVHSRLSPSEYTSRNIHFSTKCLPEK